MIIKHFFSLIAVLGGKVTCNIPKYDIKEKMQINRALTHDQEHAHCALADLEAGGPGGYLGCTPLSNFKNKRD